MNESLWQACTDPRDLFPILAARSRRRQWLFGCACCRAVWHLLPESCREAVELVERYADGAASDGELASLFKDWHSSQVALPLAGGTQAVGAAGALGWRWRWGRLQTQAGSESEPWYHSQSYIVQQVARSAAEALAQTIPWREARAPQCDLLRDLLRNPDGEPFSADSFWLAWNGGTVSRLAVAIYEERDYGQMPILADALEDAGCTERELLEHCRGGGLHVRGCWAVDALLGKG